MCYKHQYPTLRVARSNAVKCIEHGFAHKVGIYKCRRGCGRWHLTYKRVDLCKHRVDIYDMGLGWMAVFLFMIDGMVCKK